MERKAQKLLKQAGKFVTLGKLTAALDEYLKVHELEPDEPTIINTIADLYTRLENKEKALLWYSKLAEAFESRELTLNAIATYKRILKISPKNQEALLCLARLYERTGKIDEAKRHLKIISDQMVALGHYDQALATCQKVHSLDPNCAESSLELAQLLEKLGRIEEACRIFVQCAVKYAEGGNVCAATTAAENVFRLKPRNKQVLKSFFRLLQDVNQAERGVGYIRSLSLDQDPEINSILTEITSQDLTLEVSRKYLLESLPKNAAVLPNALDLLRELISKHDLNGSLEIIEVLNESRLPVQYHAILKGLLDSVIAIDDSSVRTFKVLVRLLMSMNDQQRMEGYLRRLVILQLGCGNLREGREGLNQLVVESNDGLYLDLLNLLNEGMMKGSSDDLQKISRQVIQALELGGLDKEDPSSDMGIPLGVSDLDLGIALEMNGEEDFFAETAV
jgi:tetratricopeptide (TPR) repeat protein